MTLKKMNSSKKLGKEGREWPVRQSQQGWSAELRMSRAARGSEGPEAGPEQLSLLSS